MTNNLYARAATIMLDAAVGQRQIDINNAMSPDGKRSALLALGIERRAKFEAFIQDIRRAAILSGFAAMNPYSTAGAEKADGAQADNNSYEVAKLFMGGRDAEDPSGLAMKEITPSDNLIANKIMAELAARGPGVGLTEEEQFRILGLAPVSLFIGNVYCTVLGAASNAGDPYTFRPAGVDDFEMNGVCHFDLVLQNNINSGVLGFSWSQSTSIGKGAVLSGSYLEYFEMSKELSNAEN